jgi:pyruvate kinase
MGEHPVAAVAVMRRIVDAAEKHLQSGLDISHAHQTTSIPLEMEKAIASICRALPITKIVAITRSGFAARTLAAHQVRQPILAVSDDAAAARSFNLLPGVTGIHLDIEFQRDSTDHVIHCVEALWRGNQLQAGDMILITAVGYPKSGNRMNLIQTHVVSDLVESLGWTRPKRSKVASADSADRVA